MLDANTKKNSFVSKSRVRTINNRKPINSEYAGKFYPLEKLPESLRQKYPHSVPFNGAGYPDLPVIERKILQEELSKTSKLLDYSEQFVPRLKPVPPVQPVPVVDNLNSIMYKN